MRQANVQGHCALCSPEVLIADEPATSLDVTVQAAFLDLLRDIQRRSNLAILFITHDFGVVAQMCDRVAVMYAGKIVETAPPGASLMPAGPPVRRGAAALGARGQCAHTAVVCH